MFDPLFMPKLRQDIHLNPAPADEDGAPVWTLYDPTANKYFKISWFEFECLTRFDQCKTTLDLVKSLEAETTLQPDLEDIQTFVLFLIGNHLVLADDPAVTAFLEQEKKLYKIPTWKKMFRGYLFFSMPLVRPRAFLDKTYPLVKPFLTRQFFFLALALLGYGLFLTVQRFDEFMATFMSYVSFEGIVLMILTTVVVKVFHELGHAYVATKYGVSVPIIGVAFIVLYPILYTETTNAWRLTSRSKRMHIAAAGVMTEMVLAAFALIAWHFLPPGLWQSIAFFVAFTSLISTVLVNSNPLMRFDGYFLLSDFMGIDNMQDRGFAFAKWRLRKFLLGWHAEPPEYVSAKRERFLQIFGVALMIYRLALYTGIGLIIYHVFFKPVGMILMIVSLSWFIAVPVLKELNVWYQNKTVILKSKRTLFVCCVLLLLGVASALPIQRSVEIPAVMHAARQARIFAPEPAYIADVVVKPFQQVQRGDVLFRLASRQLDYDIATARHAYRSLMDIRAREQALPDLAGQRLTIDEDIKSAKDRLNGLLEEKEKLLIKAPFAGVVRDIAPDVHVGRWVGSDKILAVVLRPEETVLSGYVRDIDVARVYTGLEGYFYPHYDPLKRFPVEISSVDSLDSQILYWQELSSVFGGALPSVVEKTGEVSLRHSSYAIEFKGNKIGDLPMPDFVGQGVVKIAAKPVSVLEKTVSWVTSVILRESGL